MIDQELLYKRLKLIDEFIYETIQLIVQYTPDKKVEEIRLHISKLEDEKKILLEYLNMLVVYETTGNYMDCIHNINIE